MAKLLEVDIDVLNTRLRKAPALKFPLENMFLQDFVTG